MPGDVQHQLEELHMLKCATQGTMNRITYAGYITSQIKSYPAQPSLSRLRY